ncbi:hypothetical protein [Rhizobium mesoamericanum]|uniref:Uncharacterized protein n=1 Tax=Rhizobium mesoamericanum STM3625 TaxID=1211777 RepID=K0PEZ9_9HYPH|nr:hypothetical protein [Rhizobium mesoamericanum]CCM75121.1 hypothetical protein BN77_2284 [Rhizobium mesoamericanum STM3625]
MTIAVREYKSGAEILANAHAIRQRIWGKPRLVNVVPTRVVELDPVPLRYWQIHKTRFDSHVYAHRRWLEALE